MLVIMNGIKDKLNVSGHDVAVLKDQAVHQSDIIAHALALHKQNGGTHRHAYIMTHDEDVHKMNAPLVLEMREATNVNKPFTFRRDRKDLMTLKHSSLESCIKAHDLENKFEVVANKFHVSQQTQKKVLSKTQFVEAKLDDFFGDVCKMLEVSKNQARNKGFERNLITHEIKNFEHLMSGPHKQLVENVLGEAMKKSAEYAAKIYGKELVNIMGVQYMHKDEMKEGSHRILAQTVTESVAESSLLYTMLSIKYNFTWALIFLYLFVCVALFRMEVYKDSLVYSTFLTSRKAE